MLAVVFLLVGMVAVSVPQPPTTIAQLALGLLIAGVVGAAISGLADSSPIPAADRS